MLDTSNMIIFFNKRCNRDSNTIRLRIIEHQLLFSFPESLLEFLGITRNDRLRYGVDKNNHNILFFIKSANGIKITKPSKKMLITFTSYFKNKDEKFIIDKSQIKNHGEYFTIDLSDQPKLSIKDQ